MQAARAAHRQYYDAAPAWQLSHTYLLPEPRHVAFLFDAAADKDD
jgi:hypothetical protein